jgi:hypothetical protein
MYEFRVYTLRDGSEKVIKTLKHELFADEIQRAGIKQTEIAQTQLVDKPR